jgi:hypothetical protein
MSFQQSLTSQSSKITVEATAIWGSLQSVQDVVRFMKTIALREEC